MASTSSFPAPSSQSDLGIGRPTHTSSPSSSATTLSSSLSLSLPRSSSTILSSPLQLARSHYASSAHHFIHRQPLDSLSELEEARRLLFDVIAIGQKDLRHGTTWQTTRDKTVILWLTLLASLWRTGSTTREKRSALPKATADLLSRPVQADFLTGLTVATLVSYAISEEEAQAMTNTSVSPEATSELRKSLLARLPPSVAASLIMASLSVEESSSTTASKSIPAKGIPFSRGLAEEMLQALSSPLASSTDSSRLNLSPSYSRILDLYSIHILGVRCAQWEEADQVVRLSLLEDEARAKLLTALHRAQGHVATISERRASAKLAGERAYELEKERRRGGRTQSVKQDAQEFMQRPQLKDRSDGRDGSLEAAASSSGSRPPVGKHRYSSSSSTSSSSSSNHASSETESDSTVTLARSSNIRTRPVPADSPVKTSASSTLNPAAEGFAATRSALSKHLAKHALQNQTSSSSSLSRADSTNPLLAKLRSLFFDRLPLSVPVLISLLAPLIVLVLSLRRLRLRRSGSSAGLGQLARSDRGGLSQPSGARGDDASLLLKIIKRLWNTIRMGTTVTYL